MAFSMTITVNWISLADEQNSSTMMFGIIGFIFQDVGHEVITVRIFTVILYQLNFLKCLINSPPKKDDCCIIQ